MSQSLIEYIFSDYNFDGKCCSKFFVNTRQFEPSFDQTEHSWTNSRFPTQNIGSRIFQHRSKLPGWGQSTTQKLSPVKSIEKLFHFRLLREYARTSLFLFNFTQLSINKMIPELNANKTLNSNQLFVLFRSTSCFDECRNFDVAGLGVYSVHQLLFLLTKIISIKFAFRAVPPKLRFLSIIYLTMILRRHSDGRHF